MYIYIYIYIYVYGGGDEEEAVPEVIYVDSVCWIVVFWEFLPDELERLHLVLNRLAIFGHAVRFDLEHGGPV